MKITKVLSSLLILSFLVIISGCVEEVTCNPPYILVGNGCCLDLNDNKICDFDEEKITTTVTTQEPSTTVISQRTGDLDVRENFFVSCKKSSSHEEWCDIEFNNGVNEITVDTGSLGAQENNLVEIATWIYNKGSSDIKNIGYDISCDQISPVLEENILTKTDDNYKSISSSTYFRCTGCNLGCECTPDRYGEVINRLRLGDETTFRIELFGVRSFPETADLDCDVRIFSEDPEVEYNFDLLIHLLV